MFKKLLQSIIRWYFKNYHPYKINYILFRENTFGFGDFVVNERGCYLLYLGKNVFFIIKEIEE